MPTAKLKITFPPHVGASSYGVASKTWTKTREVVVPLSFASAKGITSAMFLELVGEDGERVVPAGDFLLQVNGKTGAVSVSPMRTVRNSAQPAFLSELLAAADPGEDGDPAAVPEGEEEPVDETGDETVPAEGEE